MSDSRTTTDTAGAADTRTDDGKGGWIAAIVALLGGWLVVSAFLFAPMPAANFWNDIIVGAAIGIIAGYNAFKTDDFESVSTGAATLVALLGLWMVIAPFIFEVASSTAFWSDVITGALVAVLAGYNAYQGRSTTRRTATAGAEGR